MAHILLRQSVTLNLQFLGPSPSAFSGKKNPEYQLGHLMMPISNGICQYVWKDAVVNKNISHFWDHHRARFLEKNSKAQEHIQNDATLR